MDGLHTVPWQQGWWHNRPPSAGIRAGNLVLRAARGSDAWRTTSYGFVRDTAHALLYDLPDGLAAEVSFRCDYDQQFDQAGIMIRVDEHTWTKAGVEVADGSLHASAVVTRELSDWSVAPLDIQPGREITVRASRSGTALTIRLRVDDEPFRLLRVAPIEPDAAAYAGPYCCAPERDGLTVTFTGWRIGPADAALHEGGAK